MKLELLKQYLEGGHFTKICFVKRTDDELRWMICRTGVHKDETGRGLWFNPDDYDLVAVYDIKKKAYRFISAEGVLFLKSGSRRWDIISGEQ